MQIDSVSQFDFNTIVIFHKLQSFIIFDVYIDKSSKEWADEQLFTFAEYMKIIYLMCNVLCSEIGIFIQTLNRKLS